MKKYPIDNIKPHAVIARCFSPDKSILGLKCFFDFEPIVVVPSCI